MFYWLEYCSHQSGRQITDCYFEDYNKAYERKKFLIEQCGYKDFEIKLSFQ